MDREKLFRHLEQRYASKRDMISRVPLGVQPEALWQELLNQRRSKCTVLPLYNYKGTPYWYVTTDKMVAASEKIVETLYENESELDPYTDAPVVSTLEEVFYTSYVEGSQITMQAAMEFLTGEQPPRDIEEQMIANNRQAGSYASANLYRPIEESLLRELVAILTDGMDDAGQDFRTGDAMDISPPEGDQFIFPSPRMIPDRIGELAAFLASPLTHPLIKAAAAQAYMMILRPFPEGNERLGRLLSAMILVRSGYTVFSDISLSALIARKNYGYYAAMANILREENGGDLTYFLEYFLELLSRAVDERQLRLNQQEEQNRKAELELARTVLARACPSPPDDTSAERNSITPNADAGQREEVNSDHGAFQGTTVELLTSYSQNPSSILGRMSTLLLQRMHHGQVLFTPGEIAASLNVQSRQLCNSLRHLNEKGIIRLESWKRHVKTYRVCTDEETAELSMAQCHEYDSAVLDRIDELIQSNSPKDKRVGGLLKECLGKGEITVADYDSIGEASRFFYDMQLVSQMGLVKKISSKRYAIQRELKPGPFLLSKMQRRIITEMYDSFGDDIFSTHMVIATLDYSDSHINACLHRFTLLRILDCRKDHIYRYQFLVNPEDNPECFDTAV